MQITGNYANGQDVLGFTNQNGITGSFNAATGTLTLTGSSSVANYQTALDSVTYLNTSDNPSGLARTVTIITNDGAANSVAVTDTINVTPVNDAPVVVAGHTLNYTENQAATAIDKRHYRDRRRQRQSRLGDGADHRQLRQRPGCAGLYQPERHHRFVQCGDRYADPDRFIQCCELPDRAGFGDLRQHQ